MKIFLRFFLYIKRHSFSLFFANLSMLLFVLFSLFSIGLVMPFVDLLFRDNPVQPIQSENLSIFNLKDYIQYHLNTLFTNYSKEDLLLIISLTIISSFFLKNLFSILQTYFMSTVEQGIIQDIRLEVYSHLHKLSLSYFTEERKGNLISRIINDVTVINASMIWVINSIFRDPPQIISYLLLLFAFDWKLTLLLVVLFPVIGLVLSKIGNSLKRKSIKSQEKISDITSLLDETLSAIRIVKAFSTEEYEIEKFKRENNRYFKLLVSITRRRAMASPITEVIGAVFITFVLYFIGEGIISGSSDMSPGAFMMYIGIIFQIMQPLKTFGQVFNNIKEGIGASERVFQVLDTKPGITDKPDALEITSFKNRIEFKNVSFKYQTSDIVLNGINLEIIKGEVIAIVGPSGAGKSTLADLVPRFYDPVEGSISIDGIDLRDVKIKSLRSLMGIVTQEPILFNDTVGNNIAYGSEKDFDKIINAAKAANAHNFITELPQGYETVIGDRGTKLSGGQRQRLSIARALMKNPPILILDEATSSLDTESEVLVQEAIERLMEGRTSIVIAHRLSTIMNADKIIVVSEGKIAESGKHSELLKLNGIYSKLYNLQFKS